jgi:hypothetical protein
LANVPSGDGRLDIAIGGSILLNAGNRSFNLLVSGALPLGNGAVAAVADFNGDGRDDVAITSVGSQSVEIFYGQPDGSLSVASVLYTAEDLGGIVAGDFDGDGRMDIAGGLTLAQQGVIFFNRGNGQFTRSFFASGAGTIAMTASDLNHRGKTDLVFTNFEVNYRPPNVDVIFHK